MTKFLNTVLDVKVETENELVIEQLQKNPDYVEVLEEDTETIMVSAEDIVVDEVVDEVEAKTETKKSSKKK